MHKYLDNYQNYNYKKGTKTKQKMKRVGFVFVANVNKIDNRKNAMLVN